MNKKQLEANLMLFIAALIWGVAFVAQRVAIRYVGAITFGAVRFAIGALSLLPLLFYLRKKPMADPGTGADEVSLKHTLPVGILLGCVLFAASTLQQIGLYTTTAGKAGFITDLYIVFVPMIEVLFGHKLKKIIWACAAMSAVGLYLISVTGNFTVSGGDVLVLIASVIWAVHILLVDKFSKQYNPIRLSFIQYIVTAALSLPAALIFEKISLNALLQIIGPTLYMGILSTGVAYTLQIIGQRHAKASHAAIILSMESVFSCIAGAIILHENMGVRGVIGCALMAGAMVLTQFGTTIGKKVKMEKASSELPQSQDV